MDTTFAGTGFARDPSGLGSSDSINATVVQSDGKIVSVGKVNYGGPVGCAITRHNAGGTPDTSFDGDGKIIADIGIEFNCNDVALQNDGKIVVVGYILFESIYNFAVFRYNADGSPDTSFDGDGRNISAFINGDLGQAVAIQTDGKIVVGGIIGEDFGVARYNVNGSLDSSFDGDGWVTTDFFGGTDQSRAIAIQTDGKIVVTGNGRTAGGSLNDFAVARYNPNGSLDTTFDGDGKVLTDMAGNHDNAQDVAIHTDGKIVVGGLAWINTFFSNFKFGLVRYHADGSLDNSFDGDGRAILTQFGHTELYDLAIQPDGKIIAAGLYSDLSPSLIVARFNVNGSLDRTFAGVTGVGSSSAANAVSIQTDGKIIVAGYNFFEPNSDFLLVRFNSDGSSDTSFGAFGKSETNIQSWTINASNIALQSDGKIVAAGKRITPGPFPFVIPDCFIYRYDADGTLDTSFDGDGRRLTFYGDCQALAIQSDGKIIFAGGGAGNNTYLLGRYNGNGSPDSSFNNSGIVLDPDNGNNGDNTIFPHASALAVQPDGKILVAGYSIPPGQSRGSTIYRYNPNGSRDTSFDSDGKVFTNLGGDDEISSIAVQTDGKIVVAGKAQIGASYDFTVMRYNADGSLDTSFDGDGIATIDFVGGYDFVNGLAIQADGKIVVVGASSSNQTVQTSTSDSALARLNPNGSLDTSFDGDGKIRVALSNYFDTATSIAIQADGKILTSGSVMSSTNNDLGTLDNNFALVRYNSNGSFDNTYGTNGKAIRDLLIHDLANDFALDSGGRAVVAGETDGQFTVARFLGGSALPNDARFDYDGDGKTDVSIFRPSGGEWWISRSSNGGNTTVQFGAGTDKIVPADFTGDGKTDVAFWRPSTGEWFILRSEDNSYFAFHWGTNGDIPAPGDFDNDGKADAAVFRPSTGVWYISRSSDQQVQTVQFGIAEDKPIVEDYDGDGKDDIAIFRPANNQWWIWRSTQGVSAVEFGSNGDKPTPADFTGDGKADVAFFRPSTGLWFVLRSEDFSYFAFPWGTSGDIPVVGDYDGDGRADATVFRPSNTVWYKNQTTNGVETVQFGTTGDVPTPSAFVP